MKAITVIFLLLAISWSLCAKDGAQILAINSNRKGIVINQGADVGIKVGDDGVFFLQKAVDYPQLIPVAEGKAILVESNHSGWYLTKVQQPSLLVKRGTLLFIRGQDTLSGRSPWNFRQQKRIFPKKSDISRKLKVIPDSKIVRGDRYQTVTLLPHIKPAKHKEIVTTNYGVWNRDPQGEEGRSRKFISNVEHVVDRSKIEEKISNNILKTTTAAMVKKFNSLDRGLYTLYRNQEMGGCIANSKFSYPNVYNQYRDRNIDNLKKISPNMINLVQVNGGRWSSAYTDPELRSELVQSGIAYNVRQHLRKEESQGNHEILLHANSTLTDHTVETDSDQRGRGIHLAVGYEYHLQKVNRNLSSFALDVGLIGGSSFVAIDGRNARTEEVRFQLGAKWYLKGGPQVVGQKIWYVGAGYARGTARVYRSTSNAANPLSWRADLLALPYYTLGFKYRFKSEVDLHSLVPIGLGLNIGIIYEQYTLSPSKTLNGNLNGTVLTTDMKLLLGLSIYI